MLMTAERCWALPSAGQRRRAVLPLPFLAVTRELLSCGVTASRRGTCPPGSPLLCSELKFQVTAQWRPLWPQTPVVPRFIMASFQMIISEFCGPHSAVSWCRLTALGSRPPSCPAPLASDLKDHLRWFVLRLGEVFVLTVDSAGSSRKEATLVFLSPLSLLRYSCGSVWDHLVHLETQHQQQNLSPPPPAPN